MVPNRKLLVVDDEPLVRQTLSMCLEDEYDVTTAASGEEAIEISRHEDFPVVLLDLRMDGISGLETLKRLKKLRQSQNVIILTAYESMESAISALNLGAFNYLTKPFQRDHLKEVISRGFEVYEQQNICAEEMKQRLLNVHDSFLNLLCHEFNTPLNIIMGFTQLLEDQIENKEHKSWLRDIKDSGAHLHDILMEIVDYIDASHLATTGMDDEFVPEILLHSLVQPLEKKGIRLEISARDTFRKRLRGPARSIFMIAGKLVRVASHRSKYIHMNVSMDSTNLPGEALLRITVSGTGIHATSIRNNEIEQLFRPYQFMPSMGGGLKKSLGLELATCRKIAEYAKGMVNGHFNIYDEIEFTAVIPVKLVS